MVRPWWRVISAGVRGAVRGRGAVVAAVVVLGRVGTRSGRARERRAKVLERRRDWREKEEREVSRADGLRKEMQLEKGC